MTRDFKGVWADATMWLSEGLKCQTRCFLLEIDSLDKGEGCWAKNNHFARLFGMSKNRVSEVLKDLALKGYISISYETQDDGEEIRFLKVTWAVEKSIGQSKNRSTQSKNRSTQSKNRLPNNRTEKYIENNSEIYEISAFDFLKNEFPIQLEQTVMGFKSQIKDWDRFVKYFNNSCDMKELPYTKRALFGRLKALKDQWIVNQQKENPVAAEQTVKQKIGKRL